MFANFISDFKVQLYDLLSQDTSIYEKIDSIYLTPPQDAKYPFLLINILEVTNCSKFDWNMYDVEFAICIFSRKSEQKIDALLDRITNIITPKNCQFGKYQVSALKVSCLTFDQSRDLISNKLSIKYKSLIKKAE
ncbi:MAG: hypothetical protein EOP33_00110 [Rickettsiaceae bacterium]|nr:MAG: hypothetical protein EOP33_00110 [Rickettsiaceae bacterium]